MLNVMTLVPPYGWGFLLAEVEKKIGTEALQRMIERVSHQTEQRKLEDLKRALAMIKQEEIREREKKAPQRDNRA